MGRTTTSFSLNLEQQKALNAAREAIDSMIASVGGPAKTVRADIEIGNGSSYDRDFRPAKTSAFDSISARVIASITKWADDEISNPAISGAVLEIGTAVEKLNNFRSIIDKTPIDTRFQSIGFGPFLPIDRKLPLLMPRPESALPLPDFDDFFGKRVPVIARHNEIFERLTGNRLCYVCGNAACGKSTAAFIVAFRFLSRGFAAYILDLRQYLDHAEAVAAFRNLLANGRKTLVILDDANRNPSLVRNFFRLWSVTQEHLRPTLLIVGTMVSHARVTDRDELLVWPPDTIKLDVDAEHFGSIAAFYVKKFSNRTIAPPPNVLHNWRAGFANHLHAFGFAVLESRTALSLGKWVLSRNQALAWIDKNWLHLTRTTVPEKLPTDELDDLKCISVFGQQLFEISVPEDVLPGNSHSRFRYSRTLGIVDEVDDRADPSKSRFSLMEPGWGDLILDAAHVSQAERLQLIIGSARKSVRLATHLITRLPASSFKQEPLVKGVGVDSVWLSNLANSGLASVVQWLAVFTHHDAYAKRKLIGLFGDQIRNDPQVILGERVGLIVKLFSHINDHRSRSKIIDAVNAIEVIEPARSILIKSIPVGSPEDLDEFFRNIEIQSQLFQHSRAIVRSEINTLVDGALARGILGLGSLLKLIRTYFHELLHPAIEALESKNGQITALVDQASFLDLRFVAEAASFNNIIDERMVELFFARFDKDYWDGLQPLEDIHFLGAHWLVRSLRHLGKQDFAGLLATAIATRANPDDLIPVGSLGNRKIEMVANVCLNCSDPDLSARYLAMMKIDIDKDLTNFKIFDGIIANGLQTMSLIQHVDVQKYIGASALDHRLNFRRGVHSGRGVYSRTDNYVRLVGSYAGLFRCEKFIARISDFQKSTSYGELATSPSIRPNFDTAYVQNHQSQFWQGLWALSQIDGCTIEVGLDLTRDTLRRWRENLRHSAEVDPNARAAVRHQKMVNWLGACVEQGTNILIPSSGSLLPD